MGACGSKEEVLKQASSYVDKAKNLATQGFSEVRTMGCSGGLRWPHKGLQRDLAGAHGG